MPVFRPLDDQVLVRIQPPEETRGGLVVPDRAQERSLVGEVLAVGPGRPVPGGARLPVSVDPGDQVLVAKYAGDEVTLDGAVCLVVRAEDLLGVLEPDEVPGCTSRYCPCIHGRLRQEAADAGSRSRFHPDLHCAWCNNTGLVEVPCP